MTSYGPQLPTQELASDPSLRPGGAKKQGDLTDHPLQGVLHVEVERRSETGISGDPVHKKGRSAQAAEPASRRRRLRTPTATAQAERPCHPNSTSYKPKMLRPFILNPEVGLSGVLAKMFSRGTSLETNNNMFFLRKATRVLLTHKPNWGFICKDGCPFLMSLDTLFCCFFQLVLFGGPPWLMFEGNPTWEAAILECPPGGWL